MYNFGAHSGMQPLSPELPLTHMNCTLIVGRLAEVKMALKSPVKLVSQRFLQ